MFNRDFVSASSAVGLGALIGGLLSIEIASRFGLGSFLWIFGALFGGCVSYIAVDFKQLCEGVKDAYQNTVSWRPDVLYWKTVTVSFAGYSLATYSFFTTIFAFFLYIDNGFDIFLSCLKMSIFLSVVPGAWMASVVTRKHELMIGRKYTHWLLQQQKYGYQLLTRWNPLSAPFTALFYLGKSILWGVKAIPEITVWVMQVGRHLIPFLIFLLKEVHSQKRAVVFFDGAVGAVIGYLLGSALLGALVGAVILYPIHRELFAVRLLKVVPR